MGSVDGRPARGHNLNGVMRHEIFHSLSAICMKVRNKRPPNGRLNEYGQCRWRRLVDGVTDAAMRAQPARYQTSCMDDGIAGCGRVAWIGGIVMGKVGALPIWPGKR